MTEDAVVSLTHLLFPHKIVPAIEHTFSNFYRQMRKVRQDSFIFFADSPVLASGTSAAIFAVHKDFTWILEQYAK